MKAALAFVWLVGLGVAQDAAKPKLPRVLLVDDGRLAERFDETVKALQAKVVVVRASLQDLDKHRQQKWDVICAHLGARDGEELPAYGKRLEAWVGALHESAARVLWLRSPTGDAKSSAAKIDRFAMRRMVELEVEVVDLRNESPAAPLAKAILRLPSRSVHRVEHGAHCDRCRTVWGAIDLRTCRRHRRAGVVMDPRCRHCQYHGAYKFLFAKGVTKAQQQALRRGKQPATKRPSK